MASPEKEEWLRACKEEIYELESQHTYEIVDIPSDKIPLKGRWVFKKKPINNPNFIKRGHITNSQKTIRYKARWVIQGFHQKLGVALITRLLKLQLVGRRRPPAICTHLV